MTLRTSPPRKHAADHVFEELAGAILRGELAVASALPPERVLARTFDVSPLVVRQAVHRLAELGLARVRQGGKTVVLDPADASDVRVIALLYGEGSRVRRSREDVRDILEKQLLQGFCLVDLASRRATDPERGAIADLVAEWGSGADPMRDFPAFEENFWRALARAGKNRIYALEVSWWYRVLVRRPPQPARPLATVVVFYREIARRLVDRDHASSYYLAAIAPAIAALDAGEAHAVTPTTSARKGSRPTKSTR
jgi:DNA-binding FadR family transcriptional regulator